MTYPTVGWQRFARKETFRSQDSVTGPKSSRQAYSKTISISEIVHVRARHVCVCVETFHGWVFVIKCLRKFAAELMMRRKGSPMDALLTATLIPATFFNMENRLGTIDEGKLADLVLLSANPLQDISNLQKIEGVVLNGRWLDRKALNKISSDVETKIANSNLYGTTRARVLPLRSMM